MPAFRYPIRAVLACVVALPLLLTACDFAAIQSDLEDAAVVRLNLPAAPAEVAVSIVDAATGLLITGEATVSVVGDDRAAVVDPLFFEPISEITTESGSVMLAVPDGTPFSDAAPVRFDVVVRAEGYVTTGRSIAVRSTGTKAVEVQMLALDGFTPEGVSMVANAAIGSTDGQGRLESNAALTTPADPATGARASFAIPAGVTITDAAGRPLRGVLTATFAYYSPQSPAAMALFPGGFDAPIAVRADGRVEQNGAFLTGGFVSLDIFDAQGRRAEQFSTPLEIAMDLPADLINPQTEAPIALGDVIPAWTYDEAEGRWVEEGTFAVGGAAPRHGSATRSALLPFTFAVDHLSSKAAGFYDTTGGTCEAGLTVSLDGLPAHMPARAILTARGYSMTVPVRNRTISVRNFSNRFETMQVAVQFEDEVIGTATVQSPCGATPTLNVAPPADRITADFSVTMECTADQLEVRPSTSVRIRREGVTRDALLRLVNGTTRVAGGKLGATYHAALDYVDGSTSKVHEVSYTTPTRSELAGGPVTLDNPAQSTSITMSLNGDVLTVASKVIDNEELCAQLRN